MRTFAKLPGFLTVILLLLSGMPASAQPSWLDTNFVSSPVIHLPSFIPPPPPIAPARAGAISSIAPMPDGRIYVGGVFTNSREEHRGDWTGGIGIDRLCMMLLGQESIRDVIFFPQMRPK